MATAKRILIGLVFAMLLAACGSDVPTMAPLARDAVVLSFGDSLTHGTGTSPDQSYPAVLAALIERQVVRAGVPGELSAEGLQRLPEVLDEHMPALLILCHGGNDMLRRRSMDQLERNLSAMIELAHARDIAVVLIGVPEPALFGLSSADPYPRIAAQFGLPYLDKALPKILSDNDLKSDTVHPNARGYARLAREVAELLVDVGAVIRIRD